VSHASPSDASSRSTAATEPAESTDVDETRPRRPRRRLLLAAGAVVVVAAVAVAAVVAVRGDQRAVADPVPASVPVAIRASDVPDGTTVGVVITLGQGEGSEWAAAAQGGLVAERRLELGGSDVSLSVQDDGGSAEGARAAVEALVADGVAGIVVASSGSHVSGAVDAAREAGVPVVLPYAEVPGGSGEGAWSTAPDAAGTGAALQAALGGSTHTLLVDLGGGSPAGVAVADILVASAVGDDTAVADEVARLAGAAPSTDVDPDAPAEAAPPAVTVPATAVLLSGSAARQAALVAALQSADLPVPVVLTPEATSPAFSAALSERGGSLAGDLTTVGVQTDDAVALRSDAAGRTMSAFLAGVRVLARDGDAVNLTGDQPFSAVAAQADSRSHDAVLALVRAVSAAGSSDPAEVSAALGSLSLVASDGIAGPALDFGADEPDTGEVEVLHASSQALGLRPAADAGAARLVWFAGPTTD